MNPFQRLGVKISNWWRGEPQNDGGKMTLNSPSFLERIGLKRKGKPTSEVTYFTCLKMLSETLAKMPIKYYQKTDKGIIEAEATDTSKLLSKRPNPFMTPTTFWNTVEINRNHYGNGYVYMRKKFDRKKFGGEIKIVDLWVMQSNCVQIVVDDAGIFAGVGRLWYVYTDPTWMLANNVYKIDTTTMQKEEYTHAWTSDIKLKKNVKKTKETAVDKIGELEFVQFDWKDKDGHEKIGLIADQVEKIIPDAVKETEQDEKCKYSKIKSIDIQTMLVYALKAIKELSEIQEEKR